MIQSDVIIIMRDYNNNNNNNNKMNLFRHIHFTCNVTASLSSQVNLRNDDVKRIQHKGKSKTKKEMKRFVKLQWLLETL